MSLTVSPLENKKANFFQIIAKTSLQIIMKHVTVIIKYFYLNTIIVIRLKQLSLFWGAGEGGHDLQRFCIEQNYIPPR